MHNRSAVLAYIYIHMHTSNCRRQSGYDRHAHIHTPMLTFYLTCAQKNTHTFRGAPLIAPSEAFILHTQVAVYWRFGWWGHTYTHTYTHAHAWLLAQTHISPSRLQERFPCAHAALHAACVTTYCTSVRRVFIVETVVLQKVLRDIRAWSVHFLVFW